MAIEDSDPERRNLTVMSGAFIIYYLAGGSFKENQITLEVININFSRPTVLAVIAWLMLFWFIYRYWQTHRGKFESEFRIELERYIQRGSLEQYVLKNLRPPEENVRREFNLYTIRWKIGRPYAMYNNNEFTTSQHGHKTYTLNESERDMRLSGVGWMLAIHATLRTLITEGSFASLIVPYILAAVAITCGVVNYVVQAFCN